MHQKSYPEADKRKQTRRPTDQEKNNSCLPIGTVAGCEAVGYYYNITSAWAVDREFVSIYLVPAASLGGLWDALGLLWGALGFILGALGLLCGALGLPWDALGVLWGALGFLWGALGPLCGALGAPMGCPWGPRGALETHKNHLRS